MHVVAVHVTGTAGASALSHLWDWPLIPRAGSVLEITWTSEWNEYSSQVTLEGLTFYNYQVKK